MGCCKTKHANNQPHAKAPLFSKFLGRELGKEGPPGVVDSGEEGTPIERKNRALWEQIVTFDLNLGKNPELTIAKRFSRETTNDLGDTLNVAVGGMMIMEFKKFIYLCAVHFREHENPFSNTESPSFASPTNKDHQQVQIGLPPDQSSNGRRRLYLQSPFPAPPLIEKVWDLMILYTEHYEGLCSAVYDFIFPMQKSTGGPSDQSSLYFWMDKAAFNEGDFGRRIGYENYQRLLIPLLEEHQGILYPWQTLWPRYETFDEYSRDRESLLNEVWLTQNLIGKAQQFITSQAQSEHPISQEAEKSPAVIEQGVAISNRYYTMMRDGVSALSNDFTNVKDLMLIREEDVNFDFSGNFRAKLLTQEKMRERLQALNSIEFSQGFLLKLRQKLLMKSNEELASYILEYRRFLYLIACGSQMVSPSEQVDHVWHLHQNWDTAAYRNDCIKIFGRLIKHLPSLGSQFDDFFKGVYSDTINYYQSLFKTERPKALWEGIDERFTVQLFSCSSVSIEKLANIRIYTERISQGQDDASSLALLRAYGRITVKVLRGDEYPANLSAMLDSRRPFGTSRRGDYILNCRSSRRTSKLSCKGCCSFNLEEALKSSGQSLQLIFDPLFIKGGPFYLQKALNESTYSQGGNNYNNILKTIDGGFYADFDNFDVEEIKTTYPGLGPQEVLESILDLSLGDFNFRLQAPAQQSIDQHQFQEARKESLEKEAEVEMASPNDVKLDLEQVEEFKHVEPNLQMEPPSPQSDVTLQGQMVQDLRLSQSNEALKHVISKQGRARTNQNNEAPPQDTSVMSQVSEDSVFLGNPILQSDTNNDKAQSEQPSPHFEGQNRFEKQLQSRTQSRQSNEGDPVVQVYQQRSDDDGRRTKQEIHREENKIIEISRAQQRPFTPALPPMPMRVQQTKSVLRKPVREYGIIPQTIQQKNSVIYQDKGVFLDDLRDSSRPIMTGIQDQQSFLRTNNSVGQKTFVMPSNAYNSNGIRQGPPILIIEDDSVATGNALARLIHPHNQLLSPPMRTDSRNDETYFGRGVSRNYQTSLDGQTIGRLTGQQRSYLNDQTQNNTQDVTGIVLGVEPNFQQEGEDICLKMSTVIHQSEQDRQSLQNYEPSSMAGAGGEILIAENEIGCEGEEFVSPVWNELNALEDNEGGSDEGDQVFTFYDQELARLSRPIQFEQEHLPFAQTPIEAVEMALSGKFYSDHLTVLELAEAFSDHQHWVAALEDKESVFSKILQSGEVLNNSAGITKGMLMQWALLVSPGKSTTKAAILAGIILDGQSGLSPIMADSQQVKAFLEFAVDLSTRIANKFEPMTKSPSPTPELDEDDLLQIEGSKQRLVNLFLDDVFGSDTFLQRREFERRLARFGKWVFNSQAIREKVQIAMINSFKEEEV